MFWFDYGMLFCRQVGGLIYKRGIAKNGDVHRNGMGRVVHKDTTPFIMSWEQGGTNESRRKRLSEAFRTPNWLIEGSGLFKEQCDGDIGAKLDDATIVGYRRDRSRTECCIVPRRMWMRR
jgi:hypothetical protein